LSSFPTFLHVFSTSHKYRVGGNKKKVRINETWKAYKFGIRNCRHFLLTTRGASI